MTPGAFDSVVDKYNSNIDKNYLGAQVEMIGKENNRPDSFSVSEYGLYILENTDYSEDHHMHMGAQMIGQKLNCSQSLKWQISGSYV